MHPNLMPSSYFLSAQEVDRTRIFAEGGPEPKKSKTTDA